MYSIITQCRVCSSVNLRKLFQLSDISLTGVFPTSTDIQIDCGPMTLVKCLGDCGLIQLLESYSFDKMYGENYGYRSGLNKSMVDHLRGKADKIKTYNILEKGDLIVDIGSNDGTSLGFFDSSYKKVGIDPSAEKFSQYYNEDVQLIIDFFSQDLTSRNTFLKNAKIITSYSMFYDLPDPIDFVKAISKILDRNGVSILSNLMFTQW